MNAPIEKPEQPAVLDMHGEPLTVSFLKVISETLESYGQVTVINCNARNGHVMSEWLTLVIQNLQTRKTKGRNIDGR